MTWLCGLNCDFAIFAAFGFQLDEAAASFVAAVAPARSAARPPLDRPWGPPMMQAPGLERPAPPPLPPSFMQAPGRSFPAPPPGHAPPGPRNRSAGLSLSEWQERTPRLLASRFPGPNSRAEDNGGTGSGQPAQSTGLLLSSAWNFEENPGPEKGEAAATERRAKESKKVKKKKSGR